MKKQFKFLLFLFLVVVVNNIVSLDSNSDREQRLYVVTELFRTQIVAGLADKAMTLAAANWKRVLDRTLAN